MQSFLSIDNDIFNMKYQLTKLNKKVYPRDNVTIFYAIERAYSAKI